MAPSQSKTSSMDAEAESSESIKSTRPNSRYEFRESGVHYVHAPPPSPPCATGTEFIKRLKDELILNVLDRPSRDELIFELIGVDVSFANALRRIMISETPTLAIERVYIWNNTSIVHDEVLAHRIGLVPIDADPRLFDDFLDEEEEGGGPTDRNTVVFKLEVSCSNSREEDERRERRAKALSAPAEGKGGGGTGGGRSSVKKEESVLGEDGRDLETAAAESSELYRTSDHTRTDHSGNVVPTLASAVETMWRGDTTRGRWDTYIFCTNFVVHHSRKINI